LIPVDFRVGIYYGGSAKYHAPCLTKQGVEPVVAAAGSTLYFPLDFLFGDGFTSAAFTVNELASSNL
jgi:hypothetical protein